MEEKIKEVIRLYEGTEDELVRVSFEDFVIHKKDVVDVLEVLYSLKSHIGTLQVQNHCHKLPVYKYDSLYERGQFIPVAMKLDDLQDIQNVFNFSLEGIKKYIEIDGTRMFSISDEIKEVWFRGSDETSEEEE